MAASFSRNAGSFARLRLAVSAWIRAALLMSRRRRPLGATAFPLLQSAFAKVSPLIDQDWLWKPERFVTKPAINGAVTDAITFPDCACRQERPIIIHPSLLCFAPWELEIAGRWRAHTDGPRRTGVAECSGAPFHRHQRNRRRRPEAESGNIRDRLPSDYLL
jgi:hypothetical protein